MPVYEFHCIKCGWQFVDLVRAEPEMRAVVCPGCGALNAKRRVSLIVEAHTSRDMQDHSPDTVSNVEDPAALHRWTNDFSRELQAGPGDSSHERVEVATAVADDEE